MDENQTRRAAELRARAGSSPPRAHSRATARDDTTRWTFGVRRVPAPTVCGRPIRRSRQDAHRSTRSWSCVSGDREPKVPSRQSAWGLPACGYRAPWVSRFPVTNDCVPSEWAEQRYVDRRLATCTVADLAKIGDSPWERCTCVRKQTIPASEPPVRLKPCVCRGIRRRRAAAPRGR
jgi:hypothetical protein